MAGFFSKERSTQRKLKKSQKKLLNMFAQSPERQFAAQTLAEIGTDEALAILLGRFEKRTNNHTIDREEKKFVHDLLVDMGPAVVEHLTRHIRGPAELINWPLRVLRQYVEKDEIANLIADLLDDMDIEYSRNPVKKEELVLAAAEYKQERLGQSLVRFLEDANERIRFLVVDAIFTGGYAFAAEAVVKRLTGEEESIRVVTRLVDGLAETNWTVKGYKAAVEANLPEGFSITRAGTIRRRG